MHLDGPAASLAGTGGQHGPSARNQQSGTNRHQRCLLTNARVGQLLAGCHGCLSCNPNHSGPRAHRHIRRDSVIDRHLVNRLINNRLIHDWRIHDWRHYNRRLRIDGIHGTRINRVHGTRINGTRINRTRINRVHGINRVHWTRIHRVNRVNRVNGVHWTRINRINRIDNVIERFSGVQSCVCPDCQGFRGIRGVHCGGSKQGLN